jgi:hypothetical protein
LLGSNVSEPWPPVTRSSVKVHDRDDIDTFRLDTVQETVEKLRNENTPEPTAKRWTRGRKLEQAFVRLLHRDDEVEAEPLGFDPRRIELRKWTRLVLADETLPFSPKRGARLPDYLFGGNPGDLSWLEFAQPALGLLKPKLFSIGI